MTKKKESFVGLWLLLSGFIMSAFVCSILLAKSTNAADQPDFSEEMICKAGISVVMGLNSEEVGLYIRSEEKYFFSYVRESDKEEFIWKCKVEGKRIVWGDFNGRWRDASSDSKITFNVDDGILTFKEVYSDGSGDVDSYLAGGLK
jgi:hypothetical protein